MTESLVRSVVFAARKGSTALSCLAFFVAVTLATPEQTQSKQNQPGPTEMMEPRQQAASPGRTRCCDKKWKRQTPL